MSQILYGSEQTLIPLWIMSPCLPSTLVELKTTTNKSIAYQVTLVSAVDIRRSCHCSKIHV